MRGEFVIAGLALLLSSPLMAAEIGGVKLDRQDRGGWQGTGAQRCRHPYEGWSSRSTSPACTCRPRPVTWAACSPSDPRRVQLNLLRDLSADDLADALADGIKDTSSAEQVAAVKSQTDQLLSIMRSVGQAKKGDVVTMDFFGGETRIAFNGQSKGTIGGEPFNAALMRIWLADKPVQADLRKAMLGS